MAAVALLAWALLGWILVPTGHSHAWIAVWATYLAVISFSAFFGGLRFRSLRVGVLTMAGLVLTHFVYAVVFVAGFIRRVSS